MASILVNHVATRSRLAAQQTAKKIYKRNLTALLQEYVEQLAEEAKSKQNTALDVADKLMGENTSFEDLIKILRG